MQLNVRYVRSLAAVGGRFHSQSNPVFCRSRNNSKMSGSQQDYLVGKSGSPQIYVVVIDLSKIT